MGAIPHYESKGDKGKVFVQDFYRDSEQDADRQVQRFYAEADRLSGTTSPGRMVPEIGIFNVRESILGNYRMMYRLLEPDIIEVLLIHHGRRRFPYGRIARGTKKPPRRSSAA